MTSCFVCATLNLGRKKSTGTEPYARYWCPFALKLAGTILRHTFCDTEIEILANLVLVETENIREHVHKEIYWFSFQI